MDGKLPQVLKDIPHDKEAVFRNPKSRNGMYWPAGGPANKLSSVKGAVMNAKVPIFFVIASAGIGAYFLGPYGVFCGIAIAILFSIKRKLMLGEKLKVGV